MEEEKKKKEIKRKRSRAKKVLCEKVPDRRPKCHISYQASRGHCVYGRAEIIAVTRQTDLTVCTSSLLSSRPALFFFFLYFFSVITDC